MAPWLRRLRTCLILGVLMLLAVELTTRVVLSFQIGVAALTHGFGHSAPLRQPVHWDKIVETAEKEEMAHRAQGGEYLKYRPHQRGKFTKIQTGRLTADGTPEWAEVEATINAHGFRGPEYTVEKPPHTFRVLTLGASSTFGYRSRDEETYPQVLAELLRAEGTPELAFEVINFGVPHSNSAQIRNLFLAEGLALQPDVVTFYEGANDTRLLERPPLQRAFLALGEYSLLASYAGTLATSWLEGFSEADVARHLRGRADEFLGNVGAIAAECRARGIHFLVIAQQMHAGFLKPEELRHTTYAQEVELIRGRLARGERINLYKLQLLIHADIDRRLRAWAAENDVPFLDFVAVLDAAGRDLMLSWVHLAPRANRLLAGEIKEHLFQRLPALRRTP